MLNLKNLVKQPLQQLRQLVTRPPLFAGKALGLSLGYWLAGSLGGVLGAFIGHSFDIKRPGLFAYLKGLVTRKTASAAKKEQAKKTTGRQQENRSSSYQQRAYQHRAHQHRAYQQRNNQQQAVNPEIRILAQALVTLGLTGSASSSEIKLAYRRLMSQHHPDKLLAKKASPAQIEAAKEKTQAIQEAYARLKKAGKCE